MLYKELLYGELYLATPQELNDPLDLAGQLHFSATSDDEFKILSNFVFRQAFICHSDFEKYAPLKEALSAEQLGQYLKTRFASFPKKTVLQQDLMEILAEYYRTHSSLRFLAFNELATSFDELFRKFLNNSAAGCFSESNTDFLMWSHYASGHSGLCIEYELQKCKESPDTVLLPLVMRSNKTGEVWEYEEEVRRVNYRDTLPLISFYDYLPVFYNEGDVDLENLSKSWWHPYAAKLEEFFLCKLSPWASEREWRIVNINFKTTMPEERIRIVDGKAITGIYFGSKASSQMQRRVRKILWERESSIQYYQCSVDGSRGIQVSQADEDWFDGSY